MSTLGEFLRDARAAIHSSLNTTASETGISKSYLSEIERDLKKPTIGVLNKLSEHYHISVSDILECNRKKTKLSDKIMFIVNNLPKKEQKKILKVLEILYDK